MTTPPLIRTRKAAILWMRLLLGGVFVWASTYKILHPAAFAGVIANYQLLPDAWVNGFAVTLPWLELLLGFFLIFGIWLPGAVVLSNLLLVVFSGALLFNVARGLDIHCGCFTSDTMGNPKTTWYLIRNAALITVAAWLLFKVVIRKRA
jgi:hypothetical protein